MSAPTDAMRLYTSVMSMLAIIGLVLLGFLATIIIAGVIGYLYARRRGDSPREAAAWLRAQGGDLVKVPGRLRRLALDPRVPRRARWLLLGLAAYLISPLDIIPDFIPVIGQLDDVAVAGVLLWLARKSVPAEVWQEYFPPRPAPLNDEDPQPPEAMAPPASDRGQPAPPAQSPDRP